MCCTKAAASLDRNQILAAAFANVYVDVAAKGYGRGSVHQVGTCLK